MRKPYAESADQNKHVILDVIGPLFASVREVLEIGSGTGQHAVYLAAAMPHTRWQTSEVEECLPGVRLWVEDCGLDTVLAPLQLNVTGTWPAGPYDAVYTANTAHIMSQPEVDAMIAGAAAVLIPGGLFAVYGPFNYGGRYTSESNARFDQLLKARDPLSGIRNFEDLDAIARNHGMVLAHDFEMPVNNRTLVWRREG